MESWRKVFKEGFAPQLSMKALEVLKKALETDDQTLLQGATTSPPPLECVRDWPVEAACFIGYCGWKGENLTSVAEVEEFFAKACFETDNRLGEPAACRWFLNWADDSPRKEVRRELLVEVNREIQRRLGRETPALAS
jgi:hypothetical protein